MKAKVKNLRVAINRGINLENARKLGNIDSGSL